MEIFVLIRNHFKKIFLLMFLCSPVMAFSSQSDNPDLDCLQSNLKACCNIELIYPFTSDRYNAELFSAIKHSDFNDVLTIIENGADVNAIYLYDEFDHTPLHRAAEEGRLDVVQLLIEKGANINAKNRFGATPLHIAAREGQLYAVQLLIEEGLDVNAKDGNERTPLHKAVQRGHLDVIALLIEKGADINAKKGFDETSLYIASKEGHLDVVQLLIEKGANTNAKNRFGETPLYIAIEEDHLDVVQLLIEEGAEETRL